VSWSILASNSTLWPLCHVAFERPDFEKNSYEVFKKVNQKFAKAINEEIKGKTFIWVNDYQLCLVPKLIQRQKDTVIGMFWHIPWPTWEVFRILPQKKEILESLLSCDFIAFHRGYQARNFLDTIGREFEARIDQETNRVYFNKRFTTVKNLPMGIDTEAIESMLEKGKKSPVIQHIAKKVFRIAIKRSINDDYDLLFERYKVILGVDRLDYTKGLRLRLLTLDKFFEKNKKYIGKVTYFGIIAPSRVKIKSYKDLAEEINGLAEEINNKYKSSFPWMKWQPIHLVYKVFERDKIVNFYKKANLSLVTPLDDGMNLVSKEFVVAASFSENPGMIVLSQFAGSAIDLTQALIVNPYNIEEVVEAIKKGLEMSKKEKIDRIKVMKERLDEKNVYEWAEEFVRSATAVGE
ncbi:MAG: trehalose-6-phosphate synthase, partial [Patescibacteria group bacterium]|nr:trehalose-6-phosphate synthase [Patescibacteria group bacterium]